MGVVLLANCKKCDNKVQCALENGRPIEVDFGWEKENMEEACDTCWHSHKAHVELRRHIINTLCKEKEIIL